MLPGFVSCHALAECYEASAKSAVHEDIRTRLLIVSREEKCVGIMDSENSTVW